MLFRAVYSLDPNDRVPRRTGATGLIVSLLVRSYGMRTIPILMSPLWSGASLSLKGWSILDLICQWQVEDR